MTKEISNHNCKVSVIIPAYNASAYILEAIKSIENQNYQPLEIIVVDDGSQDGTADLIRAKAPNAHLIQQSNMGVAAARNTGLQEADGEFICFLDADDGWFPGKIKAQVNYLIKHPEVGLVYHQWWVWEPEQDGVYRMPATLNQLDSEQIDKEKSGWIYQKLLLDCIVHTSTVMIRRDIIKLVGQFDTTWISGQDYNYWLRVSRVCEIHKLAGTYSFYRAVSNSLSNRPKNTHYEYLIIERALNDWGLVSPDGSQIDKKEITRRLSQLAMSFGYLHFHSEGGSPEIAWRSFLKSIKHNPLNLKALLYLIAARIRAGFP